MRITNNSRRVDHNRAAFTLTKVTVILILLLVNLFKIGTQICNRYTSECYKCSLVMYFINFAITVVIIELKIMFSLP